MRSAILAAAALAAMGGAAWGDEVPAVGQQVIFGRGAPVPSWLYRVSSGTLVFESDTVVLRQAGCPEFVVTFAYPDRHGDTLMRIVGSHVGADGRVTVKGQGRGVNACGPDAKPDCYSEPCPGDPVS